MTGLADAFDAHYRERAEKAGVPYDPPAQPNPVGPTELGGLQYALGERLVEAMAEADRRKAERAAETDQQED